MIRKKYKYWLLAMMIILILPSCKENKRNKEQLKSQKTTMSAYTLSGLMDKNFNSSVDGKPIKLYWLKNNNIEMAMTNYGGRIVGLYILDKNDQLTDVSIGRNNIKDYVESEEAYFGATIGRVGNRIAKGKFTLDGHAYSIPTNNNGNTLHGGFKGFQDVVWEAHQPNHYTLVLRFDSPDMEEGFPGNLNTIVTYSLTGDNALKIEYKASTDKATVVNLTNHTYFNLNGEGSGTILNHTLQLYADKFTPVDEGLIPTGDLMAVYGTPFDFTTPNTIGERIGYDDEQLKFGGGYDHNFVLKGKSRNGMNHAATVVGDKSGIVMDVLTQEPGLQFYSGNFMASENKLKSGTKDDYRTAFCLETQHFPDSPNKEHFPSTRLDPGETYRTISIYKFSTTE